MYFVWFLWYERTAVCLTASRMLHPQAWKENMFFWCWEEYHINGKSGQLTVVHIAYIAVDFLSSSIITDRGIGVTVNGWFTVSPFKSVTFCWSYFGTFVFIVVTSSWWIDCLIMVKYPFVSSTFLVIKTICLKLLYPLQLSSVLFPHPFTLKLFVPLNLKCVFYGQHIVGSCLLFLKPVWQSLPVDRLFMCVITIDVGGIVSSGFFPVYFTLVLLCCCFFTASFCVEQIFLVYNFNTFDFEL